MGGIKMVVNNEQGGLVNEGVDGLIFEVSCGERL